MARKLRMEGEGGMYHVINRGNYRQPIFREEGAREAFLLCLEGGHHEGVRSCSLGLTNGR